VGGEPLEEERRGILVGEAVRQRDEPVGRVVPGLGVGPCRAVHIADALPDGEARHARAQGFHEAGGLEARHGGKGHGVGSAPLVDVDVVHADGPVPDPRLSGARIRQGRLHPGEHLGPSGGLELDLMVHDGLL
jgi:hypothetical protein